MYMYMYTLILSHRQIISRWYHLFLNDGPRFTDVPDCCCLYPDQAKVTMRYIQM